MTVKIFLAPVEKNCLQLQTGRIYAKKGNDKYILTSAYVDIVDDGEKDTYEITNAKEVTISDNSKGNDKYTLSDSKGLDYETFYISDANGNDSYTLDKVKFTSASYSDAIKNDKYAITDKNGNDKYKITNSDYLYMHDLKGKDTYTVTNF